jgi:bifunctional DNase/RNase
MKRQVTVSGLNYSQSQIGTYVCLLEEQRGNRKLPIIVKTQDAQVIALNVEGMKSPRPLTHEVLRDTIEAFQMDCQEAEIYSVMEGIFYSRIVVTNGIETMDIECTAGDAVAFSQVFGCPLYVQEDVLVQAGIELDSSGNFVTEEPSTRGKVLSIEDFGRMMNEALAVEDYMLAAEYRDKIKELKGE